MKPVCLGSAILIALIAIACPADAGELRIRSVSERAPDETVSPIVAPRPASLRAWGVRPSGPAPRLNLTAYADEIAAAAAEKGLDEAWVRAIIHTESAFRPDAVSPKGAQGLMQLMPATAERFGVTDPFDPGQNIRGGVSYLAFLYRRFEGDLRLATAAYNAGEGAVDRFGGVPPYSETVNFVHRVHELRQMYVAAAHSTPLS
jgi:soluble lytic murein transglycosylase-like protein